MLDILIQLIDDVSRSRDIHHGVLGHDIVEFSIKLVLLGLEPIDEPTLSGNGLLNTPPRSNGRSLRRKFRCRLLNSPLYCLSLFVSLLNQDASTARHSRAQAFNDASGSLFS